jgi:hypothetical protein
VPAARWVDGPAAHRLLDDDVEVLNPHDLLRTSQQLDQYAAAGLSIRDFPNNSVVPRSSGNRRPAAALGRARHEEFGDCLAELTADSGKDVRQADLYFWADYLRGRLNFVGRVANPRSRVGGTEAGKSRVPSRTDHDVGESACRSARRV